MHSSFRMFTTRFLLLNFFAASFFLFAFCNIQPHAAAVRKLECSSDSDKKHKADSEALLAGLVLSAC